MSSRRYVVVDVETTGFSPARDRIVEIAGVLVDDARVGSRWSTLVNPQMPIPERATAVHGITDQMVASAPGLERALAELRRFSAGAGVVAHSAGFDLSFLGRAFASEALCTVRLARALYPEAPNQKNQTLRAFLHIDEVLGEPLRSHRALDDALVTAHVLLACRRRFRRRFGTRSWPKFARSKALVRLAR